jgi:hypothetical protein
MSPLPVEQAWHIAENGEAKGPYGRAHLARLAQDGGFSRDTMVWTPGLDGWKPAGEIADLARIFTVMPPPPPAAKKA